jgi:hypothetical protein
MPSWQHLFLSRTAAVNVSHHSKDMEAAAGWLAGFSSFFVSLFETVVNLKTTYEYINDSSNDGRRRPRSLTGPEFCPVETGQKRASKWEFAFILDGCPPPVGYAKENKISTNLSILYFLWYWEKKKKNLCVCACVPFVHGAL